MGEMVRQFQWADTVLGPISDWPVSLCIAVTMALDSPIPTIVLWGPDLIQIYNDAYQPILGLRHPTALGQRTQDCWPEVWEFNAAIYNRVLDTGERVLLEDQKYVISPSGVTESRYFTIIYAPTRDECGRACGVFVVVMETTRRVLAECENVTLLQATQFAAGQLQHMFDHAPSFMAMIKLPEYTLDIANTAFMQLFSRYDLLGKSVKDALPEFEKHRLLQLLDGVCRTGVPYVASEMPVYLPARADSAAKHYYLDFVFQPIKDASGRVTAIFVDGSDKTEQHHARRELRRLNESLTDKVHRLEEAQTDLQQSRAALRKLIDHQETIKEEERKRIALNIHNDLGAVLTGIKANVSVSLDRSLRAGRPEDLLLVEAVDQTDAAIETVRRVITDLRPSVLDQLGVWAALEWYAGQVEVRTGLQCECIFSDEAVGIDLDAERSTMLFRVVQEALTNVVRHASAKQVKLRVIHESNTLTLEIKDDGKGIKEHQHLDEKSWGIFAMRERTLHFGGELNISGTSGEGTKVVMRLPLKPMPYQNRDNQR